MLKKRDMIRTAITMAGVGMSFTIGLMLHPPTAAAQRQSFTIQAPDGGDCARLGGVWKGKTCTFGSHAIDQNQSWLIRRGATVIVQTQFVNFGNIRGPAGGCSAASYQVSMQGRFFPSLGVGSGTERKVLAIQCRESIGSITSSISKCDAVFTALPCSYILSTIFS